MEMRGTCAWRQGALEYGLFWALRYLYTSGYGTKEGDMSPGVWSVLGIKAYRAFILMNKVLRKDMRHTCFLRQGGAEVWAVLGTVVLIILMDKVIWKN